MDSDLPRQTAVETSHDSIMCVVLSPPNQPVDDDLQSQLQARNWRAITMRDPFAAMAELCLAESRHPPCDETGPILVVVRPDSEDFCVEITQLITAVRRFMPSAAVKLFANGSLHQLASERCSASAPGQDHPFAGSPLPSPPTARASSRRQADLRLMDSASSAPLPPAAAIEDADSLDLDSETDQVTREEMELLFERRREETTQR